MRLTLLVYQLYLPGSHSLKDKRKVLKSILDRLVTRLKVSVAEVGYQDQWQRATLAVAWVAADGSGTDARVTAVDKVVSLSGEVEVLQVDKSDY